MKRRVIGTIAAIVLAIGGASAQSATVVAKLQNITWSLADLDPGDGITPTLYDLVGSASGYAFYMDGQYLDYTTAPSAFLTDRSVTIPYGEWPNAGASGSMSPSGGIVMEADATAPGGVLAEGFSSEYATITPQTSITLSANAVLQDPNGVGSAFTSLCLYFYCSPFSSAQGLQSITFQNDTNQFLDINIWVGEIASIPGVPELPSSVLLLTAGAFLARRPLRFATCTSPASRSNEAPPSVRAAE